jgi:hypothetical protein
VRVYLFRDHSRSDTFAYSVDVTGRNIPQRTPETKWIFVAVSSERDLPEGEGAKGDFERSGFFVFER